MDGERVFFAARTTGPFGIASRAITDRSASPGVVRSESHLFPASVAADGRIAVTLTEPGGRTAAAVIPAGGGSPQALSEGPFDESMPVFSPDGRWVALESNGSGRTEIVAHSLADGRRVALSADGGARPRWSADGRAIYFDAGRRLMRAALGAQPQQREIVFDRAGARVLAVTPTGRMLIEEDPPGGERALVVLEWLRELRQRLPLPVTAPR